MNATLEQAIRRAKCCKAESQQSPKIPEIPNIHQIESTPLDAPICGLSVNKIIRIVAEKYGFNPIEIVGERRGQSLAMARHIAIYLADKHTGLILTRIAAYFGNRDHTTIQYAIKKISDLRSKHQKINLAIQEIEKRLGCE